MTRGREGAVLLLAVIAGVALHLPSLWMGFYADDYSHQLALRGDIPLAKPPVWNLYDFGSTADWTLPSGEVEAIPWWTSPDWKIRFFRPLTSATLVLDHAVFGGWAAGYHLTNLLWYAALLCLVPALYRALGMSRGTALLGLALFAASNGAALPVGWISNRNTTIAATFVVAAMIPAVRPGPRGPFARLARALPLALLACLSKESGVVGLALLALWFARRANSAARADERRSARTAAILCAGIAIAFVACLAVAGYGTRSLFYATPWTDPGRYARNLLVLLTAGSLRLIFPLSLDLEAVVPALVVPACIVGSVIVAFLLRRAGKRLAGRWEAAYLLAWVALSLAVEGGSPPSDRVLLCAAIGSAGLLAMFIHSALAQEAGRSRLDRIVAAALLVTAGAMSAGFVVVQSSAIAGMAREIRDTAEALDVGPHGPGPRELLLLQAGSPFQGFALGGTLAVERPDPDRRFRALQLGRRALAWTREDERTFVLRSLDEPFLTHVVEGVFLSGDSPASPGTVWRTPAFDVQATETGESSLRSIRVRMRRSLDDPGVRFLIERQGRLLALTPPRIGETRELSRAVPANPLAL